MAHSQIDINYWLADADYKCEYCGRDLRDEICQVDHIWPQSREGENYRGNFAISCVRCNRNKSDHTEWLDPFSGTTSILFNPRRMKWSEHFNRQGPEVVGISPVGRATISLLIRDTPQYVPPDLKWDKIQDLYENHSLYYFLNHLRYRRIRNDFNTLYKQLIAPLPLTDASKNDITIASFATDLLLLELFFTRSTLEDISAGINMALQLARKYRADYNKHFEVLKILSILYQQRATIRYQAKDLAGAREDQKKAYDYYVIHNTPEYDAPDYNNVDNFIGYLRSKSLTAKYEIIDISKNTLRDSLKASDEFDPFYSTSHYTYLVDLMMLSPSPSNKELEVIYEKITHVLQTQGYGSNIDYAKLITLRRRWWVLHILLNPDGWQNTLISDIRMWKRLSMFNEIRELKSYFDRIKNLLDKNLYEKLQDILRVEESRTDG